MWSASTRKRKYVLNWPRGWESRCFLREDLTWRHVLCKSVVQICHCGQNVSRLKSVVKGSWDSHTEYLLYGFQASGFATFTIYEVRVLGLKNQNSIRTITFISKLEAQRARRHPAGHRRSQA